jgi:ComF family protein
MSASPLSSLRNAALDLLFPAQCLGCRSEGSFLCEQCAGALPMTPPACIICKKLKPAKPLAIAGRTCKSCRQKSNVFAFFSPYLYENQTIRDLIHQLKYQRVRAIHDVLAGLLARSLNYFSFRVPAEAIVIPIPLYPSRERVRGFNQSALIAEALCTKLSIMHSPHLLRKIKKTAPQMELTAEKRRTNLIGTFAVADQAAVKDKIIILLDDVKTTGTTLEEAARTLKAAGAKRVWAITVAH